MIEPPSLWWCRDTDGDGKCDTREKICDGFEAGFDNPEHAGNALLYGIDNWIYLANFGKRLRRRGERFEIQDDLRRGQWGLTQDAYGRTYHNNNSNYLYADQYASWLAIGNEEHGTAKGVNVRLDGDQSTWPSRVNPGINRGYQKHMLREGKLARFTSACGPEIYKGPFELLDALEGSKAPKPGYAFTASAYVPEPAGNFVRRALVWERGGRILSNNAYEQQEWLTSNDERFRPVQCITGPDGGLWIVDLYRGILQHKRFMTTFLRKQVIARGLDEPLGLGRIYRILPKGAKPQRHTEDQHNPGQAMMDALCSDNGTVRILAQQRLVALEQLDDMEHEVLRRILVHLGDDHAVPRLHAFWTLHAHGLLGQQELDAVVMSKSTQLRAALPQAILDWPGGDIERDALARRYAPELSSDRERIVRLRCVAMLSRLPRLGSQLLAALARDMGDVEFRSVAIAGLAGREHRVLMRLLTHEVEYRDAHAKFARALAAPLAKRQEKNAYLQVQAELARAPAHPLTRPIAEVFAKHPLVADDGERISRALDLRGKKLFGMHCAACHQPSGRGLPGLAPSLRDAELLHGPVERPVRIVLHGLAGKVKIAGKDFELVMPGHPHLSDADIAAILSHLRNAWGHRAAALRPEDVERIRQRYGERKQTWKRSALLK